MEASSELNKLSQPTVCVVGLGYVGMPLAEALAKRLKVIGFDIDGNKVNQPNQETNLTDSPSTTCPL